MYQIEKFLKNETFPQLELLNLDSMINSFSAPVPQFFDNVLQERTVPTTRNTTVKLLSSSGSVDANGAGVLTIELAHDLDLSSEYLDISIEGISLGRVFNNNASDDRFDVTGLLPGQDVGTQGGILEIKTNLTEAELDQILNDGVVSVQLLASSSVGFFTSQLFYDIKLEYDSGLITAPVDDFVTNDFRNVSGDLFADNGNGADKHANGLPIFIAEVEGVAANVGQLITLASGAELMINSDGTFTYDQGSVFESLRSGETFTETVFFTVSDGTETNISTLSILVRGIDRFSANSDAFTTDDVTSLSGNVFADNGNGADTHLRGGDIKITEINGIATDVGQALVLASGAVLTVTINGDFTYTVPPELQALVAGTTLSDVLTLTLSDGVETTQTALDFTIIAADNNDLFIGDASDNFIMAGLGDDTVRGLEGNDTLIGELGDDTLIGNEGDDILRGNDGQDLLIGGEGADVIIGGIDDDVLRGGLDNDVLKGGTGNDNLLGGEGSDNLIGGDGNDRLLGENGNDILRGEAGDDRLFGADGEDILFGGKGNDSLEGGDANDRLFGEDGDDILSGDIGFDTLKGGEGNDTLSGGIGDDLLQGEAGNDNLFGGRDWDVLDGGLGDDILYGETGDDRLFGGEGQDMLFGGRDFDFLHGGAGNDVLDGGLGNDVLIGGRGLDIFVFGYGEGDDTISDFRSIDDTISLRDFGPSFDSFAEVMAVAIEIGTSVVFNFSQGDILTVENSLIGDFDATDFTFI